MTILRDLSVLWSLIHVLILFIFLYESRYPRKKTLILTCIFMIPLIFINIWGLIRFGPETMGQVLLLTCTLPSLIFFFIMAKNRNAKFFFTFCLVDTLSLEIIILTNIIDFYLPGKYYVVMFVTRLIAFPLLEFLIYKFMRKSYIEIQDKIKKGWGIFAGVSALYYLLLVLMANFPTIITNRSEYIPALAIVLVLMPFMYLNIFNLVHNQMNVYNMEKEKQALYLQAAMMEQRVEQMSQNEAQTRIHHHDMRHKLQTLSVMIQKDESAEALKYIADSEAELNRVQNIRYCTNPVIDAVFSYYFQQAEEAEIRMELTLSIPNDITVNATELSTVFANSLENAIHACKKLPVEQRRIQCKCISKPQLMFQVSNPYIGKIEFDSKGQPVAVEKEHGVGTRSIAAFCDKYDAYCEYKTENGWFTFRLAQSL